MSQLAEAEERLKDIQQTNREILEALGKLEQRKKIQQRSPDKERDRPVKEDNGNKDQHVTTEEGSHDQAPSGEKHEHRTVPLTREMLDYRQLLRRKQVNKATDNRICDKFDIQPDLGIVTSVGQNVNTGERSAQSGNRNTKSSMTVAKEGKSSVERTGKGHNISQSTTVNEVQANFLHMQEELLGNMDVSDIMTNGFAMALNPQTGEMGMIDPQTIQQLEAKARAIGEQVIIMAMDPKDFSLKIRNGKELLRECLSVLDETGTNTELQQLTTRESDLMRKVIYMFAEKDSIPLTDMWKIFVELLSGSSDLSFTQPEVQVIPASTKTAVGKPQPKAIQSAKPTAQPKTTQTKSVRSKTAETVKSRPPASDKRQKEMKTSKTEGKTANRTEGKRTAHVKVPSAEKKIQTPNVKPDTQSGPSARSSVNVPPTQTPNVVSKDPDQTLTVKGAPEEQEAEPVYINESMWSDIANQQIENGATARDIRERGMDTIICLDLSDSMKGEPWKQAANFINGFIDGIQNTTLMDDVYEHVGLVTYGSETVVQQHMTCDYVEVKRKLGKLHPGGPSPLYAGFTMVYAAMNGAGSAFVSCGIKMWPRVFLITDGRPTPANMIAGPDRCSQTDQNTEKSNVLELVASLHNQFHFTVNVVPVGDFDMGFLERITGLTNGKMIAPDDWESQTRSFRNYLAACKIQAPELVRLVMGAGSESDKAEMEEFLKKHKKSGSDSDSDIIELPDYPQLGARVKRNVVLFGQNINVGTVTKHMNDGHIGVTWDKPPPNGSEREKVMYGDSLKAVVPCDEPRVLKDELIAVGCRVKRGKDWRYSNQDGRAGNLGSVFDVNPQGIVKVRWDKGGANTYRYGQDGIYFDVEIVEEIRKTVIAGKTEQTEAPVDLIEEMNLRNTTQSQSIMSSAPISVPTASVPTASESDSEVKDRERLANLRNSKNIKNSQTDLPGAVEVNAGKSVSESTLSCSTAEGESKERPHVHSGGEKDTSSVATKQSEEAGALGARPKTILSPQKIQWSWNNNGVWQVYPPKVCDKIETSFRRNPKGTALVKVGDIAFRIVFSRMEQVNVETKDKYPVNRK